MADLSIDQAINDLTLLDNALRGARRLKDVLAQVRTVGQQQAALTEQAVAARRTIEQDTAAAQGALAQVTAELYKARENHTKTITALAAAAAALSEHHEQLEALRQQRERTQRETATEKTQLERALADLRAAHQALTNEVGTLRAKRDELKKSLQAIL